MRLLLCLGVTACAASVPTAPTAPTAPIAPRPTLTAPALPTAPAELVRSQVLKPPIQVTIDQPATAYNQRTERTPGPLAGGTVAPEKQREARAEDDHRTERSPGRLAGTVDPEKQSEGRATGDQRRAEDDRPGVPGTTAPRGDVVRAALRDASGSRAEVDADPRLDRVCAEIAAVAARGGVPSAALIELLLHSRGIAEPAEHVVTVELPDELTLAAKLRRRLGPALAGRLRVGVGGAPGGPLVAIVVRATGVDLVATPRAVPAGEGFDVVATVDPSLSEPTVLVIRDDSSIARPRAALDHGVLRARVECGAYLGRLWVEIDAKRASQVRSRALVPIRCGGSPPTSFLLEPAASFANLTGPADLERQLIAIINRQRVSTGLAPLRSDDALAASARRSSERIRDRGAADAQPAQRPQDRLHSERIYPIAMIENTLEVASVERAVEELMNEPTYRASSVAPSLTHIGVGIAASADRLHVTITYARFLLRMDTAAVRQRVIDAILGAEWWRVDLRLSTVARHFAEGLATGRTPESLQEEIENEIARACWGYTKVANSILTLVDLNEIDGKRIVRDRAFDAIGVGAAQSAIQSSLAGVTWVAVLLGKK